jgi:hypothetical protein
MHEFSRSRTKISEYGKHAPVVVRGSVQVELLRDLSHVRLQRLRADHEPFGDCARATVGGAGAGPSACADRGGCRHRTPYRGRDRPARGDRRTSGPRTRPGLAAALTGLAESAPLRIVELPEGRFPPVIETTTYLLVARAAESGDCTARVSAQGEAMMVEIDSLSGQGADRRPY